MTCSENVNGLNWKYFEIRNPKNQKPPDKVNDLRYETPRIRCLQCSYSSLKRTCSSLSLTSELAWMSDMPKWEVCPLYLYLSLEWHFLMGPTSQVHWTDFSKGTLNKHCLMSLLDSSEPILQEGFALILSSFFTWSITIIISSEGSTIIIHQEYKKNIFRSNTIFNKYQEHKHCRKSI